MRAGVLALSDRDVRSHSEKISQGEERSGDEQVVFGEERSEVRIEVANCRVTTCFLKRPASGAAIFCSCSTRSVKPSKTNPENRKVDGCQRHIIVSLNPRKL